MSEGEFVTPKMLMIRSYNTGWIVSTPRVPLHMPIGPFDLKVRTDWLLKRVNVIVDQRMVQ
ncbi:hypothetical protein CCL23_17330 [Pseudomonas syringae]|uniref:Uncharacterized protein n=1 Tax=Pseudomonas syringae TaxID=317 RepID=A0AB38BMS1_PSESX|nr:hypothetical protein CCL23_17330 [Pseudomonas syringae]SFN57491.1 hypothetical protein SAMN05444065_101263 [Pseudomonas syringae]SFO40739.1 hypothetical protein SAMN05444063_105263 [Pseudomonas syringae]